MLLYFIINEKKKIIYLNLIIKFIFFCMNEHFLWMKFFETKWFSRIIPGGNISQNFSGIIFDFQIFQFSEKFWEIFQNSSESSRLFLKITEWETKISRKSGETLHLKNSVKNLIFSAKSFYFNRIQQNWEHNFDKIKGTSKLGNSERVSYLCLR